MCRDPVSEVQTLVKHQTIQFADGTVLNFCSNRTNATNRANFVETVNKNEIASEGKDRPSTPADPTIPKATLGNYQCQ